jgi:hypothetical protein
MLSRIVAPVVLALVASGCASTVNIGPRRTDEPCLGNYRVDDAAVARSLDDRPVTDLASLKFTALSARGAGYAVDMEAPVAEVAGSRSRVLALDFTGYELDHVYFSPLKSGLSAPPTLTCGAVSFAQHFGPHGGMGVRMLYPRLMWLNEARQPIGEAAAEHRTIVNPVVIARVIRFSRPPQARYAVIFTERSRLNQLFNVESATVPQPLLAPGLVLTAGGHTRRDTYVAVSTGGLAHVVVREGPALPAQPVAQYDPSPKPVELPLEAKHPAKVWWRGDQEPS